MSSAGTWQRQVVRDSRAGFTVALVVHYTLRTIEEEAFWEGLRFMTPNTINCDS